MPADCKVCTAPTVIRDLIERMRTAGISYRDAATAIKACRDYDLSHASVQRHEVNGHFSPDAILASTLPNIIPGELTMKTIVDHKLRIWWASHKDEVPNTKEVQDWLKLAAQFAEADKAVAEAQAIRASFAKIPAPRVVPALGSGE